MWNWRWNSDNYPQLDSRIQQWKEEGVQFLSYINPYVASDKDLVPKRQSTVIWQRCLWR
jgi:alpha-glucosidase